MRLILLALLAVTLAAPAAAQGQCRARPAPLPALNACQGAERVSLAAVGDVMVHAPVQRRGYASGFGPIWAAVAPWFRAADIAIANLETPVAQGLRAVGRPHPDPGPVLDGVVYTDYPLFNAHPVIIDALREAGVDVVTVANNHAMDRGSPGLTATLDALDARGMAHTGARRPGAPRDFALRLRTRLGPLALIGCSYDTNGIADPHRQVLLCFRDRAELLAAVRAEAARGGVIVLPHWGDEYQHRPSRAQRDLGRALIAAGAMAVIGHHPHVVQPWEVVAGPAGNGLIAYSLGNFVSSQRSLPRATGMLLRAEVCRTAQGLALAGAGWVPLLTAVDRQGLVVTMPPPGAQGTAGAARALVEGLVPGRDLSGAAACEPARAPAPQIWER